MMNSLNSILIEGAIKDKPTRIDIAGKQATIFCIRSVRNEIEDGITKSTSLKVPVLCYGNIGSKAIDALSKGVNVRVVGRLAEACGDLSIVAQHIEYRQMVEQVRIIEEEDTDED